MNVTIITNHLHLDLYGLSGIAVNKDYVGMAFKLSGNMWQIVKSNNIKNKGMNVWVYEPNDSVFAGVELAETPQQNNGLEHKRITLTKYAYYKHTGPYQLIKQAGLNMTAELRAQGFETISPYIEIYGHWSSDESKLETELFMNLK